MAAPRQSLSARGLRKGERTQRIRSLTNQIDELEKRVRTSQSAKQTLAEAPETQETKAPEVGQHDRPPSAAKVELMCSLLSDEEIRSLLKSRGVEVGDDLNRKELITKFGQSSSSTPKQRSPRSKRSSRARSHRSKSPRSKSHRSKSPRSKSPRSKVTRSKSPRPTSPRTKSSRSNSPLRSNSSQHNSPSRKNTRSKSPSSKTAIPESAEPSFDDQPHVETVEETGEGKTKRATSLHTSVTPKEAVKPRRAHTEGTPEQSSSPSQTTDEQSSKAVTIEKNESKGSDDSGAVESGSGNKKVAVTRTRSVPSFSKTKRGVNPRAAVDRGKSMRKLTHLLGSDNFSPEMVDSAATTAHSTSPQVQNRRPLRAPKANRILGSDVLPACHVPKKRMSSSDIAADLGLDSEKVNNPQFKTRSLQIEKSPLHSPYSSTKLQRFFGPEALFPGSSPSFSPRKTKKKSSLFGLLK